MPHERLNALLASFIPLLPLLYQRTAEDVDWGTVVTHAKPFAPKYLPPVLELPSDQALSSFYNHACNIDLISGPRWLQDAISQPLDAYLPVVDALGAIRSHFQVNVAAPSLMLWVIGLLFLGLVLLLDPADISTSSHGKIIAACESGLAAEGSSASTSFLSTSASAESHGAIKPKLVLGWPGVSNEMMLLHRLGTTLSTSFPLTPIEEEVIEQGATSRAPMGVAEANGGESALQRSPSSHVSPNRFLESSPTITPDLSSPALSNPSTASHPNQTAPLLSNYASQCVPVSVQGQSFTPHIDEMDASSTSSDFVFTVIPPSTSDLDSVADLGSPSLSQDETIERSLSHAISDVPSTMISAQVAPSSFPLPTSSMYRFGEIALSEKCSQLEDVHDSETSLEVSEISNSPVSEPSPSSPLVEASLPTVQPCPARFRALSNITEITEPSDASESTPGTPRVERVSGVHGGLASLDHNDLTSQVAHDIVDETTTASTPEVDMVFDWSQVEIPLGMDDFLPLSTSTPNLQSTISWSTGSIGDSPKGDAGAFQVERTPSPDSSIDLTDIGIPVLPAAPLVDSVSLCDADLPASPSSGVHTGVKDEVDEDEGSFEDRTATPPPASVVDVQRSPPRRVAMNLDKAALKASVSIIPSSAITRTSVLPHSFGDTSPSASPEAPVEPAPLTMSPTEASLDTPPQLRPPMLLDQQTPVVTRARRASRVLVARTGIAGQQVALTDAGLAHLVARLDESLPPEEDVRGERRRIERVTNTAMANHSADRGEPRDMHQVIHERRYSNEPIAARVERDIINAAQHPPLKNDPHIRIPVCELGRSRSSSHARSTTNVALVRRPSISTSLQDVSAIAASSLVLPQTWGHRRSHSEVVDSRAALVMRDVMRDREPRLSYAAIAARGLSSQPLRLPVVSNQPSQPSSSQNASRVNEADVETVKGKSRAVSAPAMAMSPEFDAHASWRRGNRWSVLAAPAPPSVEGGPMSTGKGKARLQELPPAAMTAPYRVPCHGGSVPDKRWPQSRLPKAPMQAPSGSVGEALKTTWVPLSSLDKDNDLRPSGSGANKMHGSMLSAICRVKLRDLGLSAQQSMAASPTVAPSLRLASGNNVASGSAPGSDAISGPGVTSGLSGSSSGSSESVVIVCSGATCVPVSFAQPGLMVTHKAPATGQPNADLVDASGDHLATSLESLWLLPTRSTADLRSSALDESADLVVASQECRPPSPTGDCPAVVRLNVRSGSLAPSSSSRFRRATAPADASYPSPLSMGGLSSRASAAVPSRCDFIPQGIPRLRMPAMDYDASSEPPRMPTRRHGRPSRTFVGDLRATSSTLPEQERRSMRATGLTWQGGH